LREGVLVAADDAGKVFAVTELLAANRAADVAIVQIACDGVVPLALSTNVAPGDTVYCLSDPLERRGYFSQGIVNRFYEWSARRPAAAADRTSALRINVSAAWAAGSSGSALLDECGNAIGQVSTISLVEDEEQDQLSTNTQPATIIFHEAASARDVLRLIKSEP
jgi:S1-C subfamily serine protease